MADRSPIERATVTEPFRAASTNTRHWFPSVPETVKGPSEWAATSVSVMVGSSGTPVLSGLWL